jgi:hypothetical protein
MPAPSHAYADYRSTPQGHDGYIFPAGGDGVWSITTGDASHAVNYSYFMYLLEGERYHLEATLDLATNLVHQGIDNEFSNRAPSPVARGGLGRATHAPDTVFDAIAGLNGQERGAGWALTILGSAAGIVPDRHVAARFIKRLNQQQAIYLREILAHLPADAKASGFSPFADESGISVPWSVAFNTLGGYHNWNLTELPEMRAWADFTANLSIGMVESHLAKTLAYRLSSKPRSQPYDAATNRYLPRAQSRIRSAENGTGYSGGVDPATGIFGVKPTVPLFNGDVMYVEERNDAGNPTGVPKGLTLGTPYYVIQANGDRAKLAATPNGPPVSFTSENGLTLSCDPKRPYDPLTGASPVNLSADDYATIHRAAVVMAHRAGHPDATPAIVKKIQAYVSHVDSSKFVNWDYAI